MTTRGFVSIGIWHVRINGDFPLIRKYFVVKNVNIDWHRFVKIKEAKATFTVKYHGKTVTIFAALALSIDFMLYINGWASLWSEASSNASNVKSVRD